MTITSSAPIPTQDQTLVLPGRHSWEAFKAIQAVMEQQPGLRIVYLDGVIEFMTLGEYHESIKSMIAILLGIYFWQREIEFIPVGSATRESKDESVSFEPDESYYLGEKKAHPDLAIEVNVSSGSAKKLEKYQRLGIGEVWMWQDKKFSIYFLDGDRYQTVSKSQLLPDLDIALLEECVMMSSPLEAMQKFTSQQK
ncbi:Uma2 family endonuclease [Synechocystis sp. LEGE 06083]|uniref:Uma2 family endonuclease n=1 Tax=Synechocystis sp. LEGE 06083 TaxID=915336 RepID=UPI001880D965|nr:Uma2 family endonuclease [Synechocystis sp. LEGE 06083]MBE9194366.1 Uma2 family endonuclease [Synechocystis sp. LEGE 06083]